MSDGFSDAVERFLDARSAYKKACNREAQSEGDEPFELIAEEYYEAKEQLDLLYKSLASPRPPHSFFGDVFF